MSLKDRLKEKQIAKHELVEKNDLTLSDIDFLTLKDEITTLLDEKINSTPIWASYNESQQHELIRQFVDVQLASKFNSFSLSKNDKDKLVREIIVSSSGYGPLDSLMQDEDVSYILVNGAKNVFTEKNGKLNHTNIYFNDDKHLLNIVERMALKAGRKINKDNPVLGAKLSEGLYINAIIPPVAVDGPSLIIKKIKKNLSDIDSFLKQGFLSNEIAQTLSCAVENKLNILITGCRGVGKTALLNELATKIPDDERIITIEDFSELNFQKNNVVRLEVDHYIDTLRLETLVDVALKMRPDRILLGECKGSEAADIMKSINFGIKGFMSTLFADSPEDSLLKLEGLMCSSGSLSTESIRTQISSAIDLIIHICKLPDGSAKIYSITEVVGVNENKILLNEIFTINNAALDNGSHISTGKIPEFIKNAKIQSVPLEFFNKDKVHTYSETQNNSKAESKKKFSAQQNPSIKNRFMQRKK